MMINPRKMCKLWLEQKRRWWLCSCWEDKQYCGWHQASAAVFNADKVSECDAVKRNNTSPHPHTHWRTLISRYLGLGLVFCSKLRRYSYHLDVFHRHLSLHFPSYFWTLDGKVSILNLNEHWPLVRPLQSLCVLCGKVEMWIGLLDKLYFVSHEFESYVLNKHVLTSSL